MAIHPVTHKAVVVDDLPDPNVRAGEAVVLNLSDPVNPVVENRIPGGDGPVRVAIDSTRNLALVTLRGQIIEEDSADIVIEAQQKAARLLEGLSIHQLRLLLADIVRYQGRTSLMGKKTSLLAEVRRMRAEQEVKD